jgi:Fe-S-cluster-containing hydrogenase component 2
MVKLLSAIDNRKCDFCGTCVAVCPTDAIELKESVIEVDRERCIGCGSCSDICPLGVPEIKS